MDQAEAKPVLRLERPLRGPIVRPLVVAQPEQGRPRHTGGGWIGQLAPHVLAEFPVGVQLATGSYVRPENGGTQRLSHVIAEDDTMHLARKSDGRDLGGVIAGGLPRGDAGRRYWPACRSGDVRRSAIRSRTQLRIEPGSACWSSTLRAVSPIGSQGSKAAFVKPPPVSLCHCIGVRSGSRPRGAGQCRLPIGSRSSAFRIGVSGIPISSP